MPSLPDSLKFVVQSLKSRDFELQTLNFKLKLRQSVNELHQAALQVGRFVAMNIAAFSQLVDHADHFGQKFGSFRFAFQCAQVFNSRTCSFFEITVLKATLRVLADALKRGTMVCHISKKSLIRLCS